MDAPRDLRRVAGSVASCPRSVARTSALGALACAAGLACAAMLAASAPCARAAAQDGEGGPPAASAERQTPREAVELFQRAREEYQTGRYAEAARDLENALVLDPGSPTLLYNLARVYELSGEHDRAIATYRTYLRVIDDEAERERTEAAIRRLEGAREYVRPDEEAYTQPLYVTQRGIADDAFWGTLIAGAAITLGGAALAIATAITSDAAQGFVLGLDGEADQRRAMFDDAGTLAIATDVVGGVGGATLLVAGLLWLLREERVELYPTASAPVALLVAPDARGGARMIVGGTF